MSYGYTLHLLITNKKADGKSLGVALGRECICRNVPVTLTASKLKVSRQTIYNWFSGVHIPDDKYTDAIVRLIAEIKSNKYGSKVIN
jgi:hypothetical protein